MKLSEIEERQEAIRAELARIEDNPAATEETDGDMVDTLVAEYETLEQRRKPLAERAQKLNLIRFSAADSANLEHADGSDGQRHGGHGPDLVVRNSRDPWEGVSEMRRSDPELQLMARADARDRSLWAVERSAKMGILPQENADTVQRRIDRDWSGGIAKHVLRTGSDEYLEAYRAYLNHPEEEMRRAALSLTAANGGYLLPYVLDPTIVLTNTGSSNPWRRISRHETTTSNAWQGVNSAGVNAAWLAEGTAAADSTPTVGQIQITPRKAAAWVYGSFEALADTNFGEQLPGLLADARDRLEENAFCLGTGTTQPFGVVTRITGVSAQVVTCSSRGALAQADLYSAHSALAPRFRQKDTCAWVMNVSIIDKARQLDTAGGSSFWTNLGQDQPENLIGKKIYESGSMVGTLASGSFVAVFGDFQQFIVVDRVGVSLLYEPLVKQSGTGTNAGFPTGQAGWFMFWRTGADAATYNSSGPTNPGFVVLET